MNNNGWQSNFGLNTLDADSLIFTGINDGIVSITSGVLQSTTIDSTLDYTNPTLKVNPNLVLTSLTSQTINDAAGLPGQLGQVLSKDTSNTLAWMNSLDVINKIMYLNRGTASDVGGYYVLGSPVVAAQIDTIYTIATSSTLCDSFITNSNIPSLTAIPAGNFTMECYLSASAANKVTVSMDVGYYRAGVFTSLGTSTTWEVISTNVLSPDVANITTNILRTTILTTDRIAVRIYAVSSSGSRTLTISYQGVSYYSHIHTPMSEITVPIDNNLLPSLNDTYDLGSSTYNWENGYIDQVYSNYIGNGTTNMIDLTGVTSIKPVGSIDVGTSLSRFNNGHYAGTVSATDYNGTLLTAAQPNVTSLGTQVSGVNIASGQTYKVNGTAVLSSSTLGSGVTASSLTSLGTQAAGVNIATAQTYKVNGTAVLSSSTLGSGVTASSLTSLGTQAAGVNIATAQTYKVNSVDVLSATTLGSGVTASSLTSLGTQAAGVNIATAQTYKVNGTAVLSSTALGSSVVSSSLTSLGVQAGGVDIASGQSYKVNTTPIISLTALGSTVVASSLTSLGTIALGLNIAAGQTYKINSVDVVGVSQTLTNKDLTSTTNNINARGIHSATTVVNLNAATAPSLGQILTATSSTAATWQSPGSSFTTISSTGNCTFNTTSVTANIDTGSSSASTSALKLITSATGTGSIQFWDTNEMANLNFNHNTNTLGLKYGANDVLTATATTTTLKNQGTDMLFMTTGGVLDLVLDAILCGNTKTNPALYIGSSSATTSTVYIRSTSTAGPTLEFQASGSESCRFLYDAVNSVQVIRVNATPIVLISSTVHETLGKVKGASFSGVPWTSPIWFLDNVTTGTARHMAYGNEVAPSINNLNRFRFSYATDITSLTLVVDETGGSETYTVNIYKNGSVNTTLSAIQPNTSVGANDKLKNTTFTAISYAAGDTIQFTANCSTTAQYEIIVYVNGRIAE